MQENATAPASVGLTRLWTVAIAIAVLYGLGLYFLTHWLQPESGMLTVTFLLGTPLAAPSLAVLVVDPRGRLESGAHLTLGFSVIGAILLVGLVLLREGGFCLIMAAPIYLGVGALSAFLVGYVLRLRARYFCLALIALPLVGVPAEDIRAYPERNEMVVSVLDIDAPPEAVWKNTVVVQNIRPSELGWTFTQDIVGVPKPRDARLAGHGAGAVRHVAWGGGMHFEERITRWQDTRELAWNFHFAKDSIPLSVEAHLSPDSAYLKVRGGSYRLAPLPNGRTRLTLETHYWMRTPLNAYCAWWGQVFISDFHRNVLRVIRGRSEKAV